MNANEMDTNDDMWFNALEKNMHRVKAFEKEDALAILAIERLIRIVKKLQQEIWELKVELNKNS